MGFLRVAVQTTSDAVPRGGDLAQAGTGVYRSIEQLSGSWRPASQDVAT